MTPYRIAETNQTFDPAPVKKGWETMTNKEARGYVWLFEPPIHNATYVIACDPAMGITNWNRTLVQDDEKYDNSAIEVFRLGKREETVVDKDSGKEKIISIPTDYQVAEFAGPVDFESTAACINALGRLYRGLGRMGVAHCIIEVYPGPGWMVEKTLISKYGYVDFYQPKYVNTLMPVVAGKGIGWTATAKSRQDLWYLGTKHLNKRNVVIRSPWLLDEMRTTNPLNFINDVTSEGRAGFHDDRLRAAMLAFWAAHDFSSMMRVETETTVEKNKKAVSWQMSDMSADSLRDEWDRRFREIGESQ